MRENARPASWDHFGWVRSQMVGIRTRRLSETGELIRGRGVRNHACYLFKPQNSAATALIVEGGTRAR